MERTAELRHGLPPVCRLGLATRGNTHLRAEDVEHAVERGLNYLNWCGKPDGMSQAIAGMGKQRRDLAVAVQFPSRTAADAEAEFARILKELGTDYLDVATLYYVESEAEWRGILAPGGVWDVLAGFQRQGALRMIGLTSHQRKLAAKWAGETVPEGHRLDMLMIRYNAAHRGAEQEIFPMATSRKMPVVTFTGLRWRALLESTPHDPAGFQPPGAAEWYRFCLSNPAVSVALTAPGNRAQLEENLRLLEEWRPAGPGELQALRGHGDRVHQHATEFW